MIAKLRYILGVSLVILSGSILAQDLHFTQYNLAPLSFNPAMTGGFYGSIRVGGMYRDQWGSAFKTPAFFIDSPILKGFRKQDWIGVGMFAFQDQGTAEYFPFQSTDASTTGMILTGGLLSSAAYHLALDKNRNTVIAVGIQGGTLSKRVDGMFTFEDALLSNGGTLEQLPSKEDPNTYLDISGGLTITGKTSGQSYYRLGFSILHISRPRANVLTAGQSNRLPMKMVGYASYYADINEKLIFTPSIFVQSLAPAREVAVQAMAGYKLPKESTVLRAGLGYRVGDALQLLFGVDYKDLRVGASYDVTVSGLSSPNNAFELGVSYIARIYKRPKVDPIIFCPRF